MSQSKIIDGINTCLKQKSNAVLTLSSSDIYAGLTDLLDHYVLENNTELFFNSMEQLSNLPHEYILDEHSPLDGFIIQLSKMLHPKPINTSLPLPTSWWKTERASLLNIATEHSPCYVYHRPTLTSRAQQLLSLNAIDNVFYAMKANPFPEILRTLEQQGVGFECVSIQELNRVLELFPEINRKRILFTPNFAPKVEYEHALKIGCHLTLDNLYPLEYWPELFKNHEVIVRIDPGAGAGHHKHVLTGGNESKFGITQNDIKQIITLTQQNHIKVVGLHAHSGSGILTPELWQRTAFLLTALSDQFPDVSCINLGGGLGIVEKPGQQPLDFASMDASLLAVKANYPHLKFWLEPGRFFVAESGVILAKVTQCKEKGSVKFIGIETGMNSLIRPTLYGAYHEIVNLSRLSEKQTVSSHIVGPICESGDTLGYDRLLPVTHEGDVLLIANTGAYGHSMSSHYNLRPPAQEFILE